MSQNEIRHELNHVMSALYQARHCMLTSDTDDNFKTALKMLTDAGIEMVKMIKFPEYQQMFNFDGWYQENVFYALEELNSYLRHDDN